MKIDSPPTWKTGRQQSQRSSGSTPSTSADARALASKFCRVRQTGVGSPVEPEVKTTARVSAGTWLGSAGAGKAGFSGAIADAACSSTAKSMPAGVVVA